MSDTRYSDGLLWLGRGASGLAVVALLADGIVQFLVPALAGPMLDEAGFDTGIAPILGIVMAGCAVLYALPKTAMLGAIVTTGFLGGAICTHVRLGEIASPPEIISLILGVLVWGGLWLRDLRLRALLPIRSNA